MERNQLETNFSHKAAAAVFSRFTSHAFKKISSITTSELADAFLLSYQTIFNFFDKFARIYQVNNMTQQNEQRKHKTNENRIVNFSHTENLEDQ